MGVSHGTFVIVCPIIQQQVGDFGFGRNICGFEASSLTMVLTARIYCYSVNYSLRYTEGIYTSTISAN